MATRNIVPRATGEGKLGTSAKKWGDVNTLLLNGAAIQTIAKGQNTVDQTSSSTTYADITDLASFSLAAAATYYFRFVLLVTTSATTEGINATINASGAISTIRYIQQYPTSATAYTEEAVTALQGGTANTAGPGTTPRTYVMEGFVTTSGAVTLAAQFKTEVGGANTSTIKAGSHGIVQRIS